MERVQIVSLLRKAVLYALILTGLDQIAGSFLDVVLDHSPDGRFYKAKYSLEECDEEIVIIGDSRGEMDYIPSVFIDSLGMTCWNASRGGQGLPYFRIMQEGILNRYRPKLVLFNVEDNMLEMPVNYERAGFLRPFYQSHPEIRPIINQVSPFERLLMQSRLYAFNSSFYYLFRPYLFHNLDGKREDLGWKPRPGMVIPEEEHEFIKETALAPLNPQSVAMFNEFMARFQEAGIMVMIVTPPNYNVQVVKSSTDCYVADYCQEHHIPLFRYSENIPLITHSEWYGDRDHLNPEGAVLFTQKVAHRIKKAMVENDKDPVSVIDFE
ncbi:MAG: hypothetical protein KDC57_10625 [Saprospiraceae bacterium]|nr:hypothetical protein [Saprospiraceae bacterium]